MGDQKQQQIQQQIQQQSHQSQKLQHPKTFQAPKDKQESIDILNVISFIQKTMETLNVYNEQLKSHLNIDLTQQEM